MKKVKLLVLFGMTMLGALYCLCALDSPYDLSSPEDAHTTIVLSSMTSELNNGVLIDSAGKEIDVEISFYLGFFIDSVYLNIYNEDPAILPENTTPFKQFVARFDETSVRDTLRYKVNFETVGMKYFVVTSYKKLGYASNATVTAFILGVNDSNNVPVFLPDAPQRVYRFDDGEKVRFPVGATDVDNDSLTFTYLFTGEPLPRSKTAQLHDGMFEWQSEEGDRGIYPILFTVTDGYGFVTTVTTIVIDTTFNSPPRITTTPPTTVQAGMLYQYQAEAFDEESTEIVWELIGEQPKGMVFFSDEAKIMWLPEDGVIKSGKLILKVTDGGEPPESDSQEIQISVIGVNRAPVAFSRSVATGMDTAIDIKLFATDPDGEHLTFSVVRDPPYGHSVFKDDSTLTYTPAVSFKGVDTILFVARDSIQSSDTASILVFVALQNQRPVAVGQQVSGTEDVAVIMQLEANDVENSELTFAVVRNPSNGVLNKDTKNWVYTPNANFNGNDTFTFVANDGILDSDPAKVIISIAAVNDIPVARNQGVPVEVNTPITINLPVSDPDDSVFTYEIIAGPLNGTVEENGMLSFKYTPDEDFNGNDTIEYIVKDAQEGESETARVLIVVGTGNEKPTANDLAITVDEDSSVTFTLEGIDPEGAEVTYTVSEPKQGILTGSDSSFVYRPNINFAGSDTFFYTVNDGMLDSDPARVVITVTPVNDLPVIVARSFVTALNTSVTITLKATDIDDSLFTFKITGGPSYGTIDTTELSSGIIQYTPAQDSRENDTMIYSAIDAQGGVSEEKTIGIMIIAENQKPVANPQWIEIPEDATRPIFLTGTDETPSRDLIYSIVIAPKHGTFEGYFPDISYKVESNYNGLDTFWFKVSDGSLESEPARVAITITPVNDPPVAMPISMNTTPGTSLPIVLQAYDIDDVYLTYQIVTWPTNGTVNTGSGTDKTITYTAKDGFSGTDIIVYRALDSKQAPSNNATITIGVATNNTPPVATPDTITLDEDGTFTITLAGTDTETSADNLVYTINTQPVNGQLMNKSGRMVTYKPNSNYYGTDEFRFTVSDKVFTSNPARIYLVIRPINDAPVANAMTSSGTEDVTLKIVLSGSDVENSPLKYVVDVQPKKGELSLLGAVGTYKPNSNIYGADSFYYHVNDGSLNSATAKVKITITAVNDPPVADPKTASVEQGGQVVITLSGSDVEGSPLTYAVTQPSYGSVTLSGNKATYTSAAVYHASDAFTYTVKDLGNLTSTAATVSITISEGNKKPVADPQTVKTAEDTPLKITLTGSDDDGDPLSYHIATQPAHGHVTLPSNGASVTYTPEKDYNGTDAFTFTVHDGELSSDAAQISITVTAVNDPPVVTKIPDQSVEYGEPFTVINLDDYVSDVDNTDANITWSVVAPEVLEVEIKNRKATVTLMIPSGSGMVTFTAKDPAGETASTTATFKVGEPANTSPTISDIADVTIEMNGSSGPLAFTIGDNETVPASLDVTASSDNPSLTSSPVLGGIAANRTITVTPVADKSGTANVTVVVSDGELSATTVFKVTVTEPVNTPPTISDIADVTIEMNGSSGPLAFTIGDNETVPASLEVTASSDNPSLTSSPVLGGTTANRTITITPVADKSGTANVTVVVSDGDLSATTVFKVTVTEPVNTPPTISNIADVTIEMNGSSGPLAFTIGDNETVPASLDVSATSDNPGLTSSPVLGGIGANRTITITPVTDEAGTANVTVRVSDGDLSVTRVFKVTVTEPVNTPPTISDIADVTIEMNGSSGPLAFTIGDNETVPASLEVTASSDNPGLTSSPVLSGTGASRTITVTPVAGKSGTANVTVVVSDGDLSATTVFKVTVPEPVNTSPTISDIADVTIEMNSSSGPLAFTIGDNETVPGSLIVTASSDNPGLTSSPVLGGTTANRTITITPVADKSGTANVTVVVSDGDLSATTVFKVTVPEPVNTSPTISDIADVTIEMNGSSGPLAFTIGDNETVPGSLIVTATSDNRGLISSPVLGGTGANRTITVTPVTDASGTANVTVVVSDGDLNATTVFKVTVNEPTSPSAEQNED